ncbi:MAG: GTP pyrophosphokinase family protein [Gordonibacter sp.]
MMGNASRPVSDRPLAVGETSGDVVGHVLFSANDDLRAPLDELGRLREMESKTREIIQKYQAAMREMEVRFEILDQDLSLKKHRNPIHHVESRIKNPASIFEKLGRYGKEPTLANMEKYIMDIAGVRVICSYIHDVYNLLELLRKQDDLTIVTVKDYIADPKPNGYRSLHVIVRIPVYFLDNKEFIPVEVQLRTIAMDFWASLEHDLKYKTVSEVPGIDSNDELKDCSRIIEDVEARMQILARALEPEGEK